jgi:Ca-activated chloride channel homolog
MLSSRNPWLCGVLLLTFPGVVVAGGPGEPTKAPFEISYHASTSEVRLTFFTTDEQNHAVPAVSKNDFAIVDGDMIVRSFRSFTRASEGALDVIVLVDASGSVATRLPSMINEVARLVSQNNSGGEIHISVLTFGGLQTSVLCSLDCGGEVATRKMLDLRADGPTPLYDALAYAADVFSDHGMRDARRILLLFSDGDDTISKTSSDDALRALVASGALVYTIDLKATGKKGSSGSSYGSGTLRQIAEATGGRHLSFDAQASNALDAVLNDLQASYVVTYELPRHSAGFHSLRILPTYNANLQFHCRAGYYYAAP